MNFENLKPNELLPHNKPMLLIDKIIWTDYNNKITTQTNITPDLIFFKGHFDSYPILPGVILIEIMFQSCGLLTRLKKEKENQSANIIPEIGKAVKIKNATFYKEIPPNTILTIEVEKISSILKFSNFLANIYEDGKIVCNAELTACI